MQSTTLLDYNSVHYNSSATSQVRPPHTSTTAQFTSQEPNPRLHDISHHGKSRLQRNACQITPRLHDIPCQPSATPQFSPPQITSRLHFIPLQSKSHLGYNASQLIPLHLRQSLGYISTHVKSILGYYECHLLCYFLVVFIFFTFSFWVWLYLIIQILI